VSGSDPPTDPDSDSDSDSDEESDADDGRSSDDGAGSDREGASAGRSYPIDGQVLMLTAAKASVGPGALPGLLARVQRHLGPETDEYRRRYELAHEGDRRAVFFVEPNHWEAVGEELRFGRRETDAVRRAHEEQLRRVGSETDRREEFETALELRTAAVIGTDSGPGPESE
jgi:hypothetical protein